MAAEQMTATNPRPVEADTGDGTFYSAVSTSSFGSSVVSVGKKLHSF